ncbi:MAG: GTP 3',8-cyclase MoaA [Verrucomicrobiae bacterium]|nr:GTP 3',8-cyclase MoaA [Verrucomicrobiae bacterium]
MARDQYGREIRYLRVSLTDACNLRCVYCMPEHMTFRPGSALLQDDELLTLIGLFAELGFEKIRFTGGEPTLRRNLVELVRAVAAMAGIRTVGLTTNGVLLDFLARPLREAGLSSVNVSLDTLDAARFRQITRWGNLRDVLAGLEAAERAGLRIKLNAVPVRGWNDGEDVVALARLTLEKPWQVRFIEMMPVGQIAGFQESHVVSETEVRARIEAALGKMTVENDGQLDGEARVYRLPGARGTIGFISPVSQPFCAGCNRVRLTADGMLRLCLLRETEVDLRKPLRAGWSRERLRALIAEAIRRKPWGHGLAEHDFATNRVMSEIGG